MLNGGKTHTALQGQSQARVGCAARSRQGSLEWVSEQRAHSIGLAAHVLYKRHTRHNKARVRRAWDARLEAGRVQRSG